MSFFRKEDDRYEKEGRREGFRLSWEGGGEGGSNCSQFPIIYLLTLGERESVGTAYEGKKKEGDRVAKSAKETDIEENPKERRHNIFSFYVAKK